MFFDLLKVFAAIVTIATGVMLPLAGMLVFTKWMDGERMPWDK